jgi:hypothetical protein
MDRFHNYPVSISIFLSLLNIDVISEYKSTIEQTKLTLNHQLSLLRFELVAQMAVLPVPRHPIYRYQEFCPVRRRGSFTIRDLIGPCQKGLTMLSINTKAYFSPSYPDTGSGAVIRVRDLLSILR